MPYRLGSTSPTEPPTGNDDEPMVRTRRVKMSRLEQAEAKLRVSELYGIPYHEAGLGQAPTRELQESRSLVRQQREARAQFYGMAQQHSTLMETGQFAPARKLEKKMGDLTEQIGQWSEHIREAEPTLKSYKEKLSAHTRALSAEIDSLKAVNQERTLELREMRKGSAQYRQTRSEIHDTQRQLSALSQERASLRREATEYTGLSPVATPRLRQRAPISFGQEAGQILRQTFNPQNLFYGLENLQSIQQVGSYLGSARQAYLKSEETRGSMLFALGIGQTGPESALDAAGRAATSDAAVMFGQGVQDVYRPFEQYLLNQVRSQTGDENETLRTAGKYAGYGFAGAGALAVGQVFGVNKLAFAGAKALGRAAIARPGIAAGAGRLAAGGRIAGGMLGHAAGVVAAPIEGLMAGFSVYDMMRGESFAPFGLDTGWKPFGEEGLRLGEKGGYFDIGARKDSAMDIYRKGLATELGVVAKYAPGGLNTINAAESLGILPEGTSAGLGDRVGKTLGALGNEGFFAAGKAAWTGQAPETIPQGKGTTGEPIPVRITKIDNPEDLVKALGQASARAAGQPLQNWQFSKDELRGLIGQFSEATGLQFGDVQNMRGAGYKALERIVQQSVKSNIPAELLATAVGQAPEMAGYGSQSRAALPYIEAASQATGIADLRGFGQAVSRTSREVQFAGLSPEIGAGIAKAYQNVTNEEGQFRADRELSKLIGGNAYDFSDLARRAGREDLALMDQQEPWRPKHEREMQQIEDRRRKEDNTRSFGYQETDIQFAEQKMGLEEKFWDYRMKRREEDVQFQKRQHALTVEQMEWGIQREEQYAQLQEEHFKKTSQQNLQLFDKQTQWRFQDLNKQESRMDTQFGWQMQDISRGREGFELQYGWQQEDMERAYRYATGRQRLDIKRQMERSSIMANRQRDDFAIQESRAETKYGWSKEDIATDRQRWEESRELQRQMMTEGIQYQQEMMDLQKEDREKRKEFAMEQLQLIKDRHQAYLDNYDEETDLMLQQHDLDMEQAGESIERQKESLAIA
ncbi:MAG: hypothetical protein KDJ97_07810, partial [Anaerolineae bacterium]|nr:hypothetical protein [Anaerolineae bacterium]